MGQAELELEPVAWMMEPPMERFHQRLHLSEMHVRQIGEQHTLCGAYVPAPQTLLSPDRSNTRRDCVVCFGMAAEVGWSLV